MKAFINFSNVNLLKPKESPKPEATTAVLLSQQICLAMKLKWSSMKLMMKKYP